MRRRVTAVLAAVLLALGLFPAIAQAQEAPAFRALLFTKTAGYRHDSIPAGVALFKQLAADNNFEVVHTEDATVFNDANLATFQVVIMFQTSGMVWDTEAQRQAVQKYVANGGGIAAIHNATDMGIEQTFPWWDELVNAGAHMPSHSPGVLQGTAKVADKQHASTAGLPDRWQRPEEWYNFDQNIRGKVHVLVTADERTYNPGPDAMGADHPISWCRDVGLAKVWSTAMGHPQGAYSEPLFAQHLLGGVKTAAKAVPSDCSATVDAAFEKVPLDTNTKAPTALTVAPDGRVYYTEILGQIKVYDPTTGTNPVALELPTYSGGEDGIVGITVDPAFATNGWIYVTYSPPGDAEINRVSRFTAHGNHIDPASEVKIIEVPASRREEPGHTGGYLTFGPGGNLYIGVGDDTNPFQSSGYAPLDERPGRDLFDAQKTSANTNDLRGKILRIKPEAAGGYTIPAGNMFAPGTAKTKPEIYAMGFRNPFRFTVDTDGTIYMADYGPDARTADPNRGPDGMVEWNIIRSPGYYGWPYCVANNVPYNDFDFATNTSGAKFDCAALKNDSPNNSGLTDLPAARPADVWYGYGASPEFPELASGGGAPMAGPVYRFDPNLQSERKFPVYYDGKPFFYEWARNKIFNFGLDSQGSLLKIDPWFASQKTLAPMDMRFGPDGAMYLLEWGGGYGRDNPDSGLYRIDYSQGNRRPVAQATATPTSGGVPLEVKFSSAGSTDPEGTALKFKWTFGDGATSTEANPTHTFTTRGAYNVHLEVTDGTGKIGSTNVTVSVGNTAPTLSIAKPVNGGFFDFGDRVPFDIQVSDPEDGQIDCSRVTVSPALGHDSHAHPTDPINACRGSFPTVLDSGHADANIFYSVDGSYTDKGNQGVPPLTTRAAHVLQPKHKQAEYYNNSSGIRVVSQAGAESGRRIGDISDGDWISFTPVNFTGIDQVRLRVSSPTGGGSVELRAGSATGQLLASVPVPNTGGWDNYVLLPAVDIIRPAGTTELFMVFRGDRPSPFDLDSMTFVGNGVVDRQAPQTVLTASAPDGKDGWYITTPTVTLAANDESGVASTEYSVDGGAWTPYTQPFPVSDGTHAIRYRSTDISGNVETERVAEFKVDTAAPVLSFTGIDPGGKYGSSQQLTVAWTATDSGSGLVYSEAKLDGVPLSSGPLSLHKLALGAHSVEVTAIDRAGRTSLYRFAFTVTTSANDLRSLVRRFAPDRERDLIPMVDRAEQLANAGQKHAASIVLTGFRIDVRLTVADKDVSTLLDRNAKALAEQYRSGGDAP
ncbi:ThuA domain-containing protein [Kibdelosporangium aridum]|uniref:Glucose/sorbosone dehydrogenases n=1 Tax=Kibdelosporangium aridum TaxID=2030 RepID=A0A1W2FHT8_KIBAR|nr:ThuA domain-containing protein [Kibdelosporangium aridum]SMD21507.1 Glucose/sorbosone dehydrogenases [Kibdelosporangium aridum]